MSEPITAWRYWHIDQSLVKVGDNLYSRRYGLRGDMEEWDGPLKQAGTHTEDSLRRLYLQMMRTTYGMVEVDEERPPATHQSPHPLCLCGVNAVKRLRSLDLLARTGVLTIGPSDTAVAFGQVELGGRVEEYEQGYRAEYARIAGPVYVVNPPDVSGWREQIERRYGQPVIVQELNEALDWIRKDEEAHGHRQAHQDTRTGPAGSPSITTTGPLTFSASPRAGTLSFVALDDPATRTGGRARSRLRQIRSWIGRDDHFWRVAYYVGFLLGLVVGVSLS